MGSGAPDGAPDAAILSGTEAHEDRRNEGKRKRERAGAARQDNKGRKAEREAHKPTKRGTPPHRQGAGSRSPHHKFAPKNQQKVAWGSYEKIFGKIFRGNVSG